MIKKEMKKKDSLKLILGFLFIFSFLSFVSPVQDASGLKINEFVSDPENGSEWVEIYNSGNAAFDLSSCKVIDGKENGPVLSGTINSGEFLAFDLSGSILNNGGDNVTLICDNQIIDSVSYGDWNDGNLNDNAPKPEDGESVGRCGDGEDTDNDLNDFQILNPTKGSQNDCGYNQEFVCRELPNYVTDVADRIIDLQHTDGSWDWVVTDATSPTGTTYRNIAGVTAEVLLDSYDLTNDSKYLDAAKDAGNYILSFPVSKTNRYNAFNILFLYNLYDKTNDVSYKNHADSILNHVLYEENYWTNNNGNNCGLDGCEADELLEALKDFRSWSTSPSGIVVWDLYNFIEASQIGGETSFSSDMANELDSYLSQAEYNDTIDYYELGLSAGIIGLSHSGLDYSSYLNDLISSQSLDGSFSSGSIQDTSYALIALKFAGENEEVEDASKYLINNFGYSGVNGWKETDGKEYSEVTSEGGQALYESYLECSFVPEPVCGNDIVEAGEECDGGDDCSNDCKVIEDSQGNGIGVDIITENFPPQIWMDPNSRVLYDDGTEPGRISEDGRELIERINNYAFEGEQISWDVLVFDKNGIEKIKDVYVTVDNNIEANCKVNSRFNDYYEAMFKSADRIVSLQADITEDNAGNGVIDSDPDDGGWDWNIPSTATEHSGVNPSWGNLYGVTAVGLIGPYKVNEDVKYLTSLEDVYTEQLQEYNLNPSNPRIRSGTDVVQLYRLYEATGDEKYRDLAEDIYLALTTVKYSSAKDLAIVIRDFRHPSWDGLIPWDISPWIEGASLLGYHDDAKDMAEVIYNDLQGNPGYFMFNDTDDNAYVLGLTGVIKAFTITNMYYDSREEALTLLLNSQNADGGFEWNSVYVNSDLQTTAYAAFELFRVGQKEAGYFALDYIVDRQLANGAFVDESSPNTEYPEVDSESLTSIGIIADALSATLLNANVDDFGSYNPETMSWYTCTLTVETPELMYGKKKIVAAAEDLDGLIGEFDEKEYWHLNPNIALSVSDSSLTFDYIRPGTSSYSKTVLVGNNAQLGSGVMMDMFISGTNFYDLSNSGALCPVSNTLELENFKYFATNGAYSSRQDSRSDSEGYVGIEYGVGFNDPNPFYNNNEILQTQKVGPYYTANLLAPGAEMSLTFRLDLPEPCNGDFDSGDIYFWGEAI